MTDLIIIIVIVALVFRGTLMLPEFSCALISSCFDYRFMESLNDVKRSRMNLINVSFPLEENSSSELTEVCCDLPSGFIIS